MNRTGRVKPGAATGRAPSLPTTRWFVSIVGVGLPLVVACATTIDGQPLQGPLDGSAGASGDADLDALGNVSTDDSTTTPTPDVGGGTVDDAGMTPMDVSFGNDSAPVTDGSQSNDGVSPMDGPSPPMDSPPPPMDSRPPPMDSPPPPVDSPPPPVDSGGMCPTRATLPYPVDGNGTTQAAFIASGYSGDWCAITQTGTPGACAGHAIAGAVGRCWSVTLTRPAPCTDAAPLQGRGGVLWQYPTNNWTDPSIYPGINMCGATKVTFWAAGATGTEVITFLAGNQFFQGRLSNQLLSTTWAQFTITLTAAVPNPNTSIGFGWDAVEPAAVGGTTKFMIDDIQWQ